MEFLQKHFCGQIADHYGQRKQEVQTVQELSELIVLLTRRKDQRGKDYKERLIDEIADSLIMIEQVRQLNGITEKEIKSHIDYKLERQRARIQEEETEGKHNEY